jgi:hypothetical protein
MNPTTWASGYADAATTSVAVLRVGFGAEPHAAMKTEAKKTTAKPRLQPERGDGFDDLMKEIEGDCCT